VTGAAHGDQHSLLAGKVHHLSHVPGTRAAGNKVRPPVDHGIEYFARRIITLVAAGEQFTAEVRFQPMDSGDSDHGRALLRSDWHAPHVFTIATAPVGRFQLGQVPVTPGIVVRSRPIGVLIMEDEMGTDEKILCVPVDDLHPYYADIASYRELPKILRDQVAHFFHPLQGPGDRQVGQGETPGRTGRSLPADP
jgi:hypothetical protein